LRDGSWIGSARELVALVMMKVAVVESLCALQVPTGVHLAIIQQIPGDVGYTISSCYIEIKANAKPHFPTIQLCCGLCESLIYQSVSIINRGRRPERDVRGNLSVIEAIYMYTIGY
jgi:hypothetical protein